MRLFYAIEFPDWVKDKIRTVSLDLSASTAEGRWSKTEHLHLTLQFLGECPSEWLQDLECILHQVVSDCPVFDMIIKDSGTFGRQQDVLWLGVERSARLEQLAEGLKKRLEQQNLPCEKRMFSPHITVARQVRIDPAILKSWQYKPFSFNVQHVSLMESARTNGCLVYRTIRKACLGGKQGQGMTK